jgi:uncharacterized protein (TIGR02231 family)
MNPIARVCGYTAPLVFWAVLWTPLAALADGVRAVTVYPDRALVVREHRFEISPGEGVIAIHPLPHGLDPASLRVGAEGPEGLILHHVETRTVHGRDLVHMEERKLTEALEAAQDERRTLADGRRAHGLKLAFIERLTENAGAVEPGLPPDQWHRAWGLIGDGALDVLEQMARIDVASRRTDAEIARLERELNALRTGRRDSVELQLHYRSASAGVAQVTLEYHVPGASWSPFYEARLDTVTGRMEFLQRAEVRQNTGEEWRDVELRLSTARPALGGSLPDLRPWFIDSSPPPRVAMERAADARALMAAPAPMLEAELQTTGFTSSYRVPGRVSLPPDNRQQRFLLATKEHEVHLSARAVPILSPQAYLFAETVFDGGAPLLPGPVTLFQDGQMVGQIRIGALAPGAPLRLAFGVDDRVEIRHELDRDTVGREGLLRRQRRLERGYQIRIDNRHDRALEVTMLDRLPVPRDERIKVELSAGSTPPTARDVDDRPGVLSWTSEFAAGESRTLRFGYTVSWPEDVEFIHGLDGATH